MSPCLAVRKRLFVARKNGLEVFGIFGSWDAKHFQQKEFVNCLALTQHVQTISIYVVVQTRRGRVDCCAENLPTWYVNFV